MCNMVVTYDDGSVENLLGRVLQNQITKVWKVDGMRAVAVLEEN